MTKSRALAVNLLLLMGCTILLLGCPLIGQPTEPVTILVAPRVLDFGTMNESMTFKVAKTWTSLYMGPFSITPAEEWIQVTPESGISTGPDDIKTIMVVVDRTRLMQPETTGTVLVAAEGVPTETVQVIVKLPVVALFSTESDIVYVGDAVPFSDESYVVVNAKANQSIDRWEWDFGDGSSGPERFEQNPTHVYTQPGDYTVSLTVYVGDQSQKLTQVNFISILERTPPVADFIAQNRSARGDIPEPVFFQDRSYHGTAPITQWHWDFGDNATSNVANPFHIYRASQFYQTLYPVSLTVQTAHGSDTETKDDYIAIYTPGGIGDPGVPVIPWSEVSKIGLPEVRPNIADPDMKQPQFGQGNLGNIEPVVGPVPPLGVMYSAPDYTLYCTVVKSPATSRFAAQTEHVLMLAVPAQGNGEMGLLLLSDDEITTADMTQIGAQSVDLGITVGVLSSTPVAGSLMIPTSSHVLTAVETFSYYFARSATPGPFFVLYPESLEAVALEAAENDNRIVSNNQLIGQLSPAFAVRFGLIE